MSESEHEYNDLFDETPPESPPPKPVKSVPVNPASRIQATEKNSQILEIYGNILEARLLANKICRLDDELHFNPSFRKCIYCMHPFDNSPIGIPIRKQTKISRCTSAFPYFYTCGSKGISKKTHYGRDGDIYVLLPAACSFPCALSFIKYDHQFQHNRTLSEAYLKEMYQAAVRSAHPVPDNTVPMLNPLCLHVALPSSQLKHPVDRYRLYEAPPRMLLCVPPEQGGLTIEEFRNESNTAMFQVLIPPSIGSYACIESTVADLAHLESIKNWNRNMILPTRQSALIQSKKLHDQSNGVTVYPIKELGNIYKGQVAQLQKQGYTAEQIRNHFQKKRSVHGLEEAGTASVHQPVQPVKKRVKKAQPSTNCRDMVNKLGIFTIQKK